MHGGGKEMLQKIYDTLMPNKIHVLGCGPYGKEAFVSTVPIRGVADLKGLKIRSPEGLAADVFRRAGAAPSSIPFSEVYTSLEKGIVDAADASVYINNHASGMHKNCEDPRSIQASTQWPTCRQSSTKAYGIKCPSQSRLPWKR